MRGYQMRRFAVPSLRLGACLAALALVASTAGAQAEPKRFNVGAMGGYYRFDDASGLEDAPFAGIDATYHFPALPLSGSLRLEPGVGFYAGAAYPTTRYDQFPVVLFDFGDTTFLVGVSQRTRLIEYGAQGTLGTTIGRLRPYVLGGVGMYAQTVDPRQEGNTSRSKPTFSLGGGLNFIVSRSLGFRAEARSITYTDYLRGFLDPTVAYTVDRRILDELSPPVPAKSTINNLRFAIVFSYVPGGSTATTPETTQPGGNP
jgi:opacity protein-like surface antigen